MPDEKAEWRAFETFVFGTLSLPQDLHANTLPKNTNLTQYKQLTQPLHKSIQTTLKRGFC